MSGNKWWSTKVGAKFLSDLVIFSIISSDISLDFHDLIQVVPLKYLIYILAGINTKLLGKTSEEKYFTKLIRLFYEISDITFAC